MFRYHNLTLLLTFTRVLVLADGQFLAVKEKGGGRSTEEEVEKNMRPLPSKMIIMIGPFLKFHKSGSTITHTNVHMEASRVFCTALSKNTGYI